MPCCGCVRNIFFYYYTEMYLRYCTRTIYMTLLYYLHTHTNTRVYTRSLAHTKPKMLNLFLLSYKICKSIFFFFILSCLYLYVSYFDYSLQTQQKKYAPNWRDTINEGEHSTKGIIILCDYFFNVTKRFVFQAYEYDLNIVAMWQYYYYIILR